MEASSIFDSAVKYKCVSDNKRSWDRMCSDVEEWKYQGGSKIENILIFDTETTSVNFGRSGWLHNAGKEIRVNNVKVFGISLARMWKEKLYLVWGRIGTPLYDVCVDVVESGVNKCGHNSRFDLKALSASGVEVGGRVDCTLTMARLVWNRRKKFGLKELTAIVCPELYGYDDELKGLMRNLKSSYTRAGYPKGYVNYSFIDDSVMSEYSMIDVFITWLLYYSMKEKVDRDHRVVYEREIEILKIIKSIEDRGHCFSCNTAREEISKIQKKLPAIKDKIIDLAGVDFNIRSSKQLLHVVVKNLKMPKKLITMKTKDGVKVTTRKDILEKAVEKLGDKRVKKFYDNLIRFRMMEKIVGTYLKPLYDRARKNNSIIHCNINPADTKTGRMASNDPNLQNVPRVGTSLEASNPVRKCFICRPGFDNLYADYSQMEMWLFAILAREDTMLETLKAGGDIHASVALQVYGEEAIKEGSEEKLVYSDGKLLMLPIDKDCRRKCKAVNFGIIYGMGFKSLAQQIKTNEVEAFDLRKLYLKTYPRIEEYVEELGSMIRKNGYVQDMFGRRYNVEFYEAYKAVNAMVQGACAQILKIAIIRIYKYFSSLRSFGGRRWSILLPIHDELEFEAPKIIGRDSRTEIIDKIKDKMECVDELMDRGIRLAVEISNTTKSWEDKHAIHKNKEGFYE